MSRRLLPNSTQIPDLILDEWMPFLSGGELKVILFIARKTYGWGKQSDALALSQIAEGTGLGLRTVNEALHGKQGGRKGLIAMGMVTHTPSDLPAGHPKAWSTFALNLDADTTGTPDATEITHAESARVHESNPCEKRIGNDDQPVRFLQDTHAESAQVHAGNPCEKRTQQETEKHYRQEAAATCAPAYTHTRGELPPSAAAAASLPMDAELSASDGNALAGQIIPRGMVSAGFPDDSPDSRLADAVSPVSPIAVDSSAVSAPVALTLDAFEPMPWGKGYDAFRAAFPGEAQQFDQEIADRAGTERAIRKPPEVYFRQRMLEILSGERSPRTYLPPSPTGSLSSRAALGAAVPITVSVTIAQTLARQRADREQKAASAATSTAANVTLSAPEGAH